ncbi:MAG: M15 family metallopeptidase [Eubacteriales bacterium]|nr:M15 family metallopeptidase [Eubacteriales bacterium]
MRRKRRNQVLFSLLLAMACVVLLHWGSPDAHAATTTVAATKITKAVSKKASTNTITWKRVSAAKGYIVYYSKSYDGKYKALKTITNNKTTTYTHKGLKNGTPYYYKVVTYKVVNGQKIKNVSEICEKYCDYYGYAEESYFSRCNRIFGKDEYTPYKTSKQASKNMKTIKIKVWDLRKGKKYTRTFTLKVHKNIAGTVQKMFAELYKSKNPTPIHTVGAYAWRGDKSTSEHCQGLAIDINANENYMIYNGKILSGSFWNPKKSKYSIPLECDLVTIFEKYGFTRGFWSTSQDYMHFSYFGT